MEGASMKTRLALGFAAFALGSLVCAAAAQAKGASQATITGKSLNRPIVVRGNGEPGQGSRLADLAEQSGFFPEVFGQTPNPMLPGRPKGKLGPKYTVTYLLPGRNGSDAIRQDLYPSAASGPVSHVRPGQSFFDGQKTHGGWFLAQSSLKTTLAAAGLRAKASAASTGGSAHSRSGTKAVLVGVPVAFLLLGAGSLALRRRRSRPPEEG
jgi:hypothetical protein